MRKSLTEESMDMRDLVPWGRGRGMSRFGDTEPFSALQREMNRMFDEAWRGFGAPMMTGGSAGNWPSLGFSENETGYTVTAEVPGLEEKDIDLSVANDVLTIKGEKKSTTEDPSKHFSEHFYGSFQRRISLPNDIDRDKVSGRVQERRADRHAAESTGGAEAVQADRDQEGLIPACENFDLHSSCPRRRASMEPVEQGSELWIPACAGTTKES